MTLSRKKSPFSFFLHGLYNCQVVPIIVHSYFAQISSKNLLIHIKVATQPTCVLQQKLSLLINILIFSVCFLLDSKNFEVAAVFLFTSVILNRVSHPQFFALTPCTYNYNLQHRAKPVFLKTLASRTPWFSMPKSNSQMLYIKNPQCCAAVCF